MSLRDQSRRPNPDVINLVSDDEEDAEDARFQKELKQALTDSQAAVPSSQLKLGQVSSSSTAINQPSDRPAPMSAFLAERAQLEKERRERQKRLRPPTPEHGSTTEEDDSETEEPPAKRHQVSPSNHSRRRSNISGVSSSKLSAPEPVPTVEQVFWNGELRQTATMFAEPRRDGAPTFRLTEVLGKVCCSLSKSSHC